MKRFERKITIVLDRVGIGEAPDAKSANDQGADTLGHLWLYWNGKQRIPELEDLGKCRSLRATPLKGIKAKSGTRVAVGKMREVLAGKDS